MSGTLELTFRCNLRCAHCYVTQSDSYAAGRLQSTELTTGEIYSILDQIVDEGCLFLLLTGGEPLLRADFVDIYTYAKRRGLLLILFTNGTLLTPELADLLGDWRPRFVEISLYGHTKQTYERVTGIPGSYERCRHGIDLLLERDVALRLKTMAMTLTRDELDDMRAFAEGLGLDFRFDPDVSVCLDGSRTPVNYRLSPEEVVQLDLADSRRAKSWRGLYERWLANYQDAETLYTCGAGLTSFHIDAHGWLSPCMQTRQSSYDLRSGTFREGWREYLGQVRSQKAPPDYPCARCRIRAFCNNCPGWGFSETGEQTGVPEFLCQVAHLRSQWLAPQAENV